MTLASSDCSSTTPASNGLGQSRTERAARAGHLDVQPARPGRLRWMPTPTNRSPRTPSNPQSSRSTRSSSASSAQNRPLSRLYAVMTPSDPPSRDGPLERHEVDLAEGPLVDRRVDRVALELRLVAGEVLDGGGDPLALHAPDVGVRQHPAEKRVLREALERATGQGRALDVHGGRQQARRASRRAPRGRARRRRPQTRSGSQVAPSAAPARHAHRPGARRAPMTSRGRRWARRSSATPARRPRARRRCARDRPRRSTRPSARSSSRRRARRRAPTARCRRSAARRSRAGSGHGGAARATAARRTHRRARDTVCLQGSHSSGARPG